MTAHWQRCFIALKPDQATRAHLLRLPVAAAARRVRPDDLHLTLAFLGGVTLEQKALLDDALPLLAAPVPALAFEDIEHWPDPACPRVAVAAFALNEALRERIRDVRRLLEQAALPVESRPFRPHVTLARFRDHGQARACAIAQATVFDARFDAVALYSRSAAPSGPRYTSLTAIPLAAR